MEEEKIKKVFAWIRNNSRSSGFLGSLAAGIVLLIVRAMLGGITFKMVYETLINLDVFTVFGIIFLIIAAILGTLLVKQRYNDSISKVKLELEERTKQYNALIDQVKLSRPITESLTIEEGSYPVVRTPYGIPHIIFDMRVINRTYFTFEPEKATIECFCNGETEPITVTCNKEGGRRKEEQTHIHARKLLKYEDDKISCHIPIEKLYDNLSEWKLSGRIEYKVKGDMLKLEDLQLKSPVKLEINVKYVLPEDEQKKLKEEVEKALGEEEK